MSDSNTSSDQPSDPSDSGILGNIAKTASTVSQSHSLTIASDTSSYRRLMRFYLQALARELLPHERVAQCLHALAPRSATVDLMYSPQVKRAHYKGLIVCARVWICPVCASKISERRRVDLSAAIAAWPGSVAMVTYTLRHSADDSLPVILGALLGAFRATKSGRAWQSIARIYGVGGSVRALEVTYGRNGWHPHFHELMFLSPDVDPDALLDALRVLWLLKLEKQGRDASWENGVDLQTANSRVADYVAKYGRDPVDAGWTLSHEMAKASTKTSHPDGMTPFQLLLEYGENIGQGLADEWPAHKFREYAAAFKGKKQLEWSRGLRDRLGLNDEATDDDLATEDREDAVWLASLTRDQWNIVLGNDVRGQLLDVASAAGAAGNIEPLRQFLAAFGIELQLGSGQE